ncbi:MAG: peptidoglycan-binding protein [Pseudomonadota bacterium]
MKRFLATTALLTLAWASPAFADGVALVIGNGDYANAPTAQTAVRDAKAVGEALGEAGWQVTTLTDLDRDAMRAAIGGFSDVSGLSSEVIIFYSGHAIRSGGMTYLAPTDAKADTLTDVLFDGVPLDLVLRIAAESAGRATVFLDGAQLRGFTPTDFAEPGLDALEAPEGVLIVSAAEPGRAVRRSYWRESRFARLIIDQFLQPGAIANEVAAGADAPTFTTGDADADFAIVPEPEPVEAGGLEYEIELAYWRTAERSGKAEDYAAYLERYPEGTFAEFARERLGLDDTAAAVPDEPAVPPEIQAERDLNLSRIRKRQIQTWLFALGHDPNGIDGLFGRGSRKAIRGWQQKNGFEANSWLTAEQVEKLQLQGEAAIAEQKRIAEEQRRIREAEDNAYWSVTGANAKPAGYRAYLEKYPEGLHAKVARAALAKIAEAKADAQARKELRIFNRTKKQDTAEAYRDYLGTYPEGIYRDQALARLDEIEGAERAAAEKARLETAETALKLSKPDMQSIEQRLRYLGFAAGQEDGVFDERTRAAIKGYQSSRSLTGTGYLDRETVVTLVNESNQKAQQTEQQTVRIDGAQVIKGLLDALNRSKVDASK